MQFRYPKDDPGIESTRPGETQLYEVHRHPFGLILLYVGTIIGFLAAFGLLYWLIPQISDNPDSRRFILMGTFVVAVIVAISLLLATYVYSQNKIIVSDKNVTLVFQFGVFRRKASELSMSNVEDVNAIKNGLFANMFNFGTLNVETAGEVENFVFQYCPRPNYYANEILAAREKYVEQNPAEAARSNDRLNLPGTQTTTTS